MKQLQNSKELIRVYGLSALFIFVGFYIAYQYAGPAPTQNITIATGSKSGAYHHFARGYSQRFNKDGVKLNVLETEGSVDNLSKLKKGEGNVYAALVQGGIGRPEDFPMVESLGSLYYEPLWLFHVAGLKPETLGDLIGKRIALGRRGSGTYALASQLLAENNVTARNSKFLEISDNEGTIALTTGKADVFFVVAGTNSKTVMHLLNSSEVVLYSFDRAAAYVRNFKFLSEVILPEGSVDLVQNIPNRDITLVAPTANLIVHNDLHPALMYLFLMAADEAHRQGGLLEKEDAFPNSKGTAFPLNKEARRFYQSGPPFLMRILPFRLATWLVRMFVMVIPVVTIVYPLLKVAPPMYNWRVRRKLHRLYHNLNELELDMSKAQDKTDLEKLHKRLDSLKNKAVSVHVPASCLESQYNLRRHIDLMEERLKRVSELSHGQTST